MNGKNISILREFIRTANGTVDHLHGGEADNIDSSTFNQHELELGARHEHEHTNDKEIAREIATDHLAEDPHYYTNLDEANDWMDTTREIKVKDEIDNDRKNNADIIAEILRDYGYDPERFVAAGAFGYVFIGEGPLAANSRRKMAIKVTGTSDASAYQKIAKATANLPDEIKRFFPKVYGVDQIGHVPALYDTGNYMDDTKGLNMFAVSMEILTKAPENVIRQLTTAPARTQIRPLDPLAISKITRATIDDYNEAMFDNMADSPDTDVPMNVKNKLTKQEQMQIEKLILAGGNISPFGKNQAENLASTATPAIRAIIGHAADAAFAVLRNRDPKMPFRACAITFAEYFKTNLDIIPIPVHNYQKHSKMVDDIPGGENMMKALQYAKSVGILWKDVHGGNIMMRPSTGELVICDVGMFDFVKGWQS